MSTSLIGGMSRSWQDLLEPFCKALQSNVMAFRMPCHDQGRHLGEPRTIFKYHKRWKSKDSKPMAGLPARFIFDKDNLKGPIMLPSRLPQCSAKSALTTDLQSIGSRRPISWQRIGELFSPILRVFEAATTLCVKGRYDQPVGDEGVENVIVGLSYSHHPILRWRGQPIKSSLSGGNGS